jgi:NAD+ diphosphatase
VTEDALADFPFRHSLHDRLGNHRSDADFVVARWADPGSRVLVLRGTDLAVTDDGARLAWIPPGQAPPGERLLLGGTGGLTHFAVLARGHDESRVEFDDIEVSVGTGDASRALHFAPLRQLAQLLPDVDASYAVHATSLAMWHQRHPRCSICGANTELVGAGDSRRCAECGTSHFPRTDPAVIMTVVDDAGRVLLGHNVAREDGWYSTLAGFVDPGETPEDAVAREVFEEVGVRVDRVTYLGSQPWPFPSSLMLGFEAHASSMAIEVDGLEITAARWFTRDELRAAVESSEVGLPTTVSIAGALITHWYGEDLPTNVLQT